MRASFSFALRAQEDPGHYLIASSTSGLLCAATWSRSDLAIRLLAALSERSALGDGRPSQDFLDMRGSDGGVVRSCTGLVFDRTAQQMQHAEQDSTPPEDYRMQILDVTLEMDVPLGEWTMQRSPRTTVLTASTDR